MSKCCLPDDNCHTFNLQEKNFEIMKFNGIDGQTVELRITNYQFPDDDEGGWDSNWLNIYLKVDSKCGQWQTIDPSLTTLEVQELINWFNNLSENKEVKYREMLFIEPNLSFELCSLPNDRIKKVRIKFDLESRPQSATEDKEYFVEIFADNDELKRIGRELKDELDRYPERKPTA